jgi:hypothetical protein
VGSDTKLDEKVAASSQEIPKSSWTMDAIDQVRFFQSILSIGMEQTVL